MDLPAFLVSGGSEGVPPGQNFFIFVQYLGKIGQIIGWRPPQWLVHPLWEILDPLLLVADLKGLRKCSGCPLQPSGIIF